MDEYNVQAKKATEAAAEASHRVRLFTETTEQMLVEQMNAMHGLEEDLVESQHALHKLRKHIKTCYEVMFERMTPVECGIEMNAGDRIHAQRAMFDELKAIFFEQNETYLRY